jgi:hypothetical protein
LVLLLLVVIGDEETMEAARRPVIATVNFIFLSERGPRKRGKRLFEVNGVEVPAQARKLPRNKEAKEVKGCGA